VTIYYIIGAVGGLVAIINFALGWAHRGQPAHALVRFAAGVVSLVPSIGFVITKLILQVHLPTVMQSPDSPRYVFIAAGLLIGATLMLPAYIERSGTEPGPTLQERAARPANATIRLKKNSDEWVN
jgi:hypothetical protein